MIIEGHFSKEVAQLPSGQDTLLPHDWKRGHSSILALHEPSKHFTGVEGGQVEIVGHASFLGRHEPSGHKYGIFEEHVFFTSGGQSLIFSTHASFQHLIPVPQEV